MIISYIDMYLPFASATIVYNQMFQLTIKPFSSMLLTVVIITLVAGCNGAKFEQVEVCYQSQYVNVVCVRKSADTLQELLSNEATKSSEKPIDYITISDGKVKELDEGSIVDLPGTMQNIWALQISNVGLKTIKPGAFRNISKIGFNLAQNELEEIEEGVFTNLPGITEIILALYKISKVHEKAFENMPDLKKIDLSHNKLVQWNPNWFIGSPVQILHMSYNKFEILPPQAFKFLSASPNDGSILRIDFSNNKLTELHRNTFEGVQKIDNMDMSENSLSRIDPDIFKDTEIREFYIQANRLVCIPPEHYDGIFKATLTAVFSNPWKEECLNDMKKWSEANSGKLLIYTRHEF